MNVFRYFTVYGPAGRPDMSLFRFVQWISEGRLVTVYGDGQQSRDFTYVDDIARGTIAGLKPLGYEVINLGSDQPVVLMDAIRLWKNWQAKAQRWSTNPAIPPMCWRRGRTSARRSDSWAGSHKWGFQDGVRRLVIWYQQNREWVKDVDTGR